MEEEKAAQRQYHDLLMEHELEAERILLAKAQVSKKRHVYAHITFEKNLMVSSYRMFSYQMWLLVNP